ncbi:MAG: cyclic nucleotide-binding domain-containing protein [Caldilineaceae bacterium]|nr:cyclic nucleotide-binding domain-containing protein [Caldilineaceae bacterium]
MDLASLFRNETNAEVFSAGDTIFEAGDQADSMYVVIEGQADIVFNGHVIETIEPGGVLGELALVDQSVRSAAALAKTDVKLARVDKRRFNFLVQEHPFFALHIMGIMAARLRRQTT